MGRMGMRAPGRLLVHQERRGGMACRWPGRMRSVGSWGHEPVDGGSAMQPGHTMHAPKPGLTVA